MNAKVFVKASATLADGVLTSTDFHEICTFAVLDTYDLMLPNKRHIHQGLYVTTPSLKINSLLQVKMVETFGLVFRGEAPETLMVAERDDLPKAIHTGDHLVKKHTTLQNFTLVILDTKSRTLIDPDGLQKSQKFHGT